MDRKTMLIYSGRSYAMLAKLTGKDSYLSAALDIMLRLRSMDDQTITQNFNLGE